MAIDTNNKKTALEEDAVIYTPNRETGESEQWKSMNAEEKKIHFREYYMVPLFAGLAVAFIVVFLIYDAVSRYKDVVYMTTIINDRMDKDSLREFNNDLLGYLGGNPKKEEIRFEDNYLLSGGSSADTLSASEAITSYIYAKQLDSIIADTHTFDHYASLGCFCGIKDILTPEQYTKYEQYLYYPELENTDRNQSPSGMGNRPDKTYACGIMLSESQKYKSLGGAQTQPVIGFIVTSEHIDDAAAILEYLFDR